MADEHQQRVLDRCRDARGGGMPAGKLDLHRFPAFLAHRIANLGQTNCFFPVLRTLSGRSTLLKPQAAPSLAWRRLYPG
jgi:hypothetical protein